MAKKRERVEIDNFKSTTELTSRSGLNLSTDSASADDDEPYNPFEHRTVLHPTSTVGSILHFLKACLGSGILAMPSAFKNAGLAAGVVGTLLAGVVCTTSVNMLVKAAQEVCVEARKPSLSYAEACGNVFEYGPKKLRKFSGIVETIVDYGMATTYISILFVYVVFIGTSIMEVADYYFPELNFSIQMYCGLTLIPLVLICQIRNLKFLVPFSGVANVIMLLVLTITLYYIFAGLPPIGDQQMVASVSTWPLFLSTVVFAMEGIGVVMPIENEMKYPEKFLGCTGVLNMSMLIVILLYGMVGFFGFVRFGDAAKGSITLNLPQDDIIAQSTKLLMALVIFFTYALAFYVPMEMITRLLNRQDLKFENLIQIVIRTFLVCFTVGVAAAFPNLELFISLVGALFFSTLGLLIPAVVETVHRWDRGLGTCYWILWKNIIIGAISLLCLVSGSYVSVQGLIKEFYTTTLHENIEE